MPNTSAGTKRKARGATQRLANDPDERSDVLVGTISTPDDTLIGALKLQAAARYLSLSPLTLHRLVDRGLLRPSRATRHLIFPISELNRFLRDHQTG